MTNAQGREEEGLFSCDARTQISRQKYCLKFRIESVSAFINADNYVGFYELFILRLPVSGNGGADNYVGFYELFILCLSVSGKWWTGWLV
jgi:hypothetical protein